MRLASIYLLCIATNAQGSHHKISDSKQISTWILNQPLSFQSRRAEGIIDARSDSSIISQTEKVINIYRYYSERGGDVGTDNEIVDALGISYKVDITQAIFIFLLFLLKTTSSTGR